VTKKKLSEITPNDIGRAVLVPRPASYASGRRVFFGKLTAVEKQQNYLGRAEYTVTIECSGQSIAPDHEQIGPLRGDFPVKVLHRWRDREPGVGVIRVNSKPRRQQPFNPFVDPNQ